MTAPLNVAIIGTGFMGRAHSNAWMSVGKFFDLPRPVSMRVACGRDAGTAEAFAGRWGWAEASGDFAAVVGDDDVELVDVTTPNFLHAEHSIAALEAGRHVACEKPLAGTLDDARAMRDAARAAADRGARSYVWFNYRRCPAIAYARRLIATGRLGPIRHVRACYLQDWGGPEAPPTWRFDAELAGSGAHGDLNAHVVDLARFLTGDEIVEVAGALEARFVEDRSVDDAVLFLARFQSGAVASFEATRVATGNLNANRIEINGVEGSLKFDFERMNELAWLDGTADRGRRGWTTIMCTDPAEHPYIRAYWPPGHPIGYEHQFVSQASDIIRDLDGDRPEVPLPDFEDAYRTQRVLHAALVSARKRQAVKLAEIGEP